MNLRLRVFAAVVLMLGLTVVGAWLVAGGAVLRPLLQSLSDERLDTAIFVARRLQEEPVASRRDLARRLSKDEGVRLRLYDELPEPPRGMRGRGRVIEREGYVLYTVRSANAPVLVALGEGGGGPFLGVHFRVDLERPQRAVGVGLLLLLVVALLGATAASRWMLAPLELAGEAMQRVADGELGHRVQAGTDAAGRIGATFNRMAQRVQGLLTGQRELMAAVSHELRTPLSRMRLNLEMLRDEGAPEGRVLALERDIEEMDALVGELLESARLHQGQLALRREELDLPSLIDEALAGVDLGERPVRLELLATTLVADRARMVRVLRNLFSNVARYTPADSELSVRTFEEGERLGIEVADRGPGVAPDELERLFEPFYRTEGSRSRIGGGLGLGLMLVRQTIEAHGGRVWAERREGGGLAVQLRLPKVSAASA